ncbi:MAG TPA: hypothetical protein VGM90_16450 [Kofleriaceae bacterium]|jgi:hypothetical protein
MSRALVVAAVILAGVTSFVACSKSAGPQSGEAADKGAAEPAPPTGNVMGKAKVVTTESLANAQPANAGGADPQRLAPIEGTLAIDVPADAKAGAEVEAKILVTPGSGYHINKEFPIKLALIKADGVALAKEQLTAGGSSASKGDADTLEESKLAFTVKLTPQAGSHTITGTFKFAVCDKDSCLPKKEPISIVVAAK